MTRVFPQASPSDHSAAPCSSAYTSKCTFTVWMKSLIFHGKGCTVFDSKGDMVYRIDNYSRKNRSKVYLMDAQGIVLVSLFKRKLSLLGSWVGLNSSVSKAVHPWFIVKNKYKFLKRKQSCEVWVLVSNQWMCYMIEGSKSGCMSILKQTGEPVAEMQRKVGRSGVMLGSDVFSLVVDCAADPSLIMGLAVVYHLIKGNM